MMFNISLEPQAVKIDSLPKGTHYVYPMALLRFKRDQDPDLTIYEHGTIKNNHECSVLSETTITQSECKTESFKRVIVKTWKSTYYASRKDLVYPVKLKVDVELTL